MLKKRRYTELCSRYPAVFVVKPWCSLSEREGKTPVRGFHHTFRTSNTVIRFCGRKCCHSEGTKYMVRRELLHHLGKLKINICEYFMTFTVVWQFKVADFTVKHQWNSWIYYCQQKHNNNWGWWSTRGGSAPLLLFFWWRLTISSLFIQLMSRKLLIHCFSCR